MGEGGEREKKRETEMFGDERIYMGHSTHNTQYTVDNTRVHNYTGPLSYAVLYTVHSTQHTSLVLYAVLYTVHVTQYTVQYTEHRTQYDSSLLSLSLSLPPALCPLTCIAESSSSSKDTGRGIFFGRTAMYAAHSDFLPMLFSRIKKSGNRSSSLRTER